MAANVEDKTFDAEAIRNTTVNNGTVIDTRGLSVKTIIIENGLDQQVTLQMQASAHSNFSNSFNVGSSVNVAATTDTYETSDNYFPYIRFTAQCSTAPTSGDLTVLVIRTA